MILGMLVCGSNYMSALTFLSDRIKIILHLCYMTKAEIKNEIQKVLDNVPENVLQDILNLLKSMGNQPGEKLALTHSLRKILTEDKELLEKLAQ